MRSTTAAIVLIAVSAAAEPQLDTPAAGRLAFEAATIKLAAPDAVRNRVTPTPNRLYIPSMTLRALIYAAYGDGGFNTAMSVSLWFSKIRNLDCRYASKSAYLSRWSGVMFNNAATRGRNFTIASS